ncbi:MAG: glycosyltransferase family 1 protein [Magnetococcales bacterium]|nr:glycosyltransferase family 1 protein [Magnetococcales bacterium]
MTIPTGLPGTQKTGGVAATTAPLREPPVISQDEMDLLQAVVQLDKNDDVNGLHSLIASNRYSADQVTVVVPYLLAAGRVRAAYLLAMILDNAGRRHTHISLALGAGGLAFGRPVDEARGVQMLWAQTDAQSVEQQQFIDNRIVRPLVNALLNNLLGCGNIAASDAYLESADNVRHTLRVMELLRAAVPCFRPIFDMNAPIPELSLAEMRQRGREQSRLIHHPLPPADVPRQRRRVLVFQRERYHTHPDVNDPGRMPVNRSRLSHFGPLMVEAMNAYGWDAEFCPIFGTRFRRMVDCIPFIVEMCRQRDPDIMVIEQDAPLLHFKQEYMAMLIQLRRAHPRLKVVGQVHDSWFFKEEELIEVFSLLDVVWEPLVPSRAVWKHPSLQHKMLQANFMHSGQYRGSTALPLAPNISLFGSIGLTNWPRIFWLAAIKQMNLPVKREPADQHQDGLPALESYAHYMQRLGESTCSLNLLMRMDHGTTVVGRTFETLYSGALLVQEAAPEMHCHFIAGEHYLEISSVADLAAVVRFMAERPEEAEEIRRCGYVFAHEHYSGEKLIGYLDYRLYFADTAAGQ